MTDLEWFIKMCNWEFDHFDYPERLTFDCYIWQAIAARLLGLDK